jgi:Ca2+-binding RTX toxin-like protein
VIYAKSGDDTITGVGSGDVVYASSGNDTIVLDAGAVGGVVIDANVGDDYVAGGAAVDNSFVNLGSGGDYLLLDGCGNRVLGGSGNDEYENHASCSGSDPGTLDLGNGDDVAWVEHAGLAALGNGNDSLTTQSPRVVNAGSGNDVVRFDGGGDATVYLAAGNDRLLLGGASLVTAFGNSGQDEVAGTFDDSVINTESGEDVIELLGSSSGNRLAGGGNRDLARLAPASSGTSCTSLERIVDLDGDPRACS